MSGSASRRPRPVPAPFSRAAAILVEVRGEVEHAGGYMASLPSDDSVPRRLELLRAVDEALTTAFRAQHLSDLEGCLATVENAIRSCLQFMEQVQYPPTVEWHHVHHMALDWLHCSLGRLKVAATSARLEEFMRSRPPGRLEN